MKIDSYIDIFRRIRAADDLPGLWITQEGGGLGLRLEGPIDVYTGGSKRLTIDSAGRIDLPTATAAVSGLVIGTAVGIYDAGSGKLNFAGTFKCLQFGAATDANGAYLNFSGQNDVVLAAYNDAGDRGIQLITRGAGSVTTPGGIRSSHATTGIGYSTGAGGTVIQATNKSTGVTLNTVTGIITMNNASLAADTSVAFVLTDSAIALPSAGPFSDDPTNVIVAEGFFPIRSPRMFRTL